MSDRLIRAMPPMANDWTLGLASGLALHPEQCAELRAAIDGDRRDAIDELFGTVVLAIESANSSYFRFDLRGAVAENEPVVHRIPVGRSTRDIGLGLVPGHGTRKLVGLVVVAVEGHDVGFDLDGHDKHVTTEVGQLIMVPSYCSVTVAGSADAAVEVAAFHAVGAAFR